MSLNIDANLKLDVRVNGTSFDLPTKGSIDRSSEISTASLTYPNDNGKLFRYFNPYDIIEIYVGVYEFPIYPAFSGVVTSMRGSRDIEIGLHGKLWQATRRYITLTDTYNLDGMEISEAIAWLIKQLDFKFDMDFLSTGQKVVGEMRDSNIDFYPLIKKLRGQVTEYNEFSEPFKYVLFEHGRKELLFRKQVDIYDGNSWFDFQYGDNLIDEYPAVKMLSVINSQKDRKGRCCVDIHT